MRYTVSVQNQTGFPFLLVFMFMSIASVVIGFFLRGLLSFLTNDSSSFLIQVIDWFLMAGLFGLFFSLVGVLSGGLVFLYKLRQMVKRSQQQHAQKNDFEYNAEFRRIPNDES